MEIEIRSSEPSDAQQIFDLRGDPRIREMNYAPLALETPETMLAMSDPGSGIPTTGFRSSTILVNGSFAGHISQIFKTSWDGGIQVTLGWNILPELWGQGIMPKVLHQYLDDGFKTNEAIEFVACCFQSNLRCVRVIEKLGFEYEKLKLSERLNHWCMTWGKHRVIKHRMTEPMWKKKNGMESHG